MHNFITFYCQQCKYQFSRWFIKIILERKIRILPSIWEHKEKHMLGFEKPDCSSLVSSEYFSGISANLLHIKTDNCHFALALSIDHPAVPTSVLPSPAPLCASCSAFPSYFCQIWDPICIFPLTSKEAACIYINLSLF